MLRAVVIGLVAGTIALPPTGALAKKPSYISGEAIEIPTGAACPALPAPAYGTPWAPGERLAYDLDVMGAQAGKLALVALPPVGTGKNAELPFRALAASNSFFSKIRRVRGRSTSYVRASDMHPRRYREDSNEGGVIKSADVVFKRKNEGRLVTVQFQRNKAKGKANLRYLNEAFDPLSAMYYLRTIELKDGMPICFDAYSLRKLWRVSGKVKGIETVRVPAGTFQAWHIEGVAVRTDNPKSHREVHLWISNDEKRLPLAALGVIDLGPVRAQLTHVGTGTAEESEENLAVEAPAAR